jgi:hypothetical protein
MSGRRTGSCASIRATGTWSARSTCAICCRPRTRCRQDRRAQRHRLRRQGDRLFVTGKNWPKLFQIRLKSRAACGTASADNAAPPDAPSIYLAPPRRASARTTRSQITRPVKVGCRTAAWSCKSAAATGAAAPRAYRIGGSPHGEPQTSDTTSPGIMTRGVWGQWQRRRQSNHRDLRPDRLLLHYLVQMIYQFGFITSSRPMRVKSLVTIC